MKTFLTPLRFGAWALFMLGVLSFSVPSRAEAPRVLMKRSMEEVMTIRGKLEVYRTDFEDGGYLFQTMLNENVLYTEPEGNSLRIDTSYPQKGPARFVLLRLPSGGTACPAFYRVLEIKEDGNTVRSKQIGNCGNNARSSYSNGVVHIDFPKAGKAAPESWIYQNGKVSRVTPPRLK